MPALHVVVPIYNERSTLDACLDRIVAASLPAPWTRALWLVDDHSEPAAYAGAETAARRLRAAGHRVALLRHEVNRGKGAALRTGFDAILSAHPDPGDLAVIQDADLEYDPSDFAALMAPIIAGEANVVIGTRWRGCAAPPRSLKRRVHAWGNGVLTALSNLMTGYRVSDMECCYKLMTADVLRRVRPMLTEDRFGVEPQLVASLARLGERVREVPVRYDPRSVAEGKKIGIRDGLRALWVIARERLRGRARGASR
jgi:glycosyltransferase involved in cell wall biosynthesis